MVPRAQGKGQSRAYDIGKDVVRIEVATIRQESLDYFRTDSEACGADYESNMDATATRELEYPVKGKLLDTL